MGQPAWEHVLFLPGRLQACCCHDWDNRSNSVTAEVAMSLFLWGPNLDQPFHQTFEGLQPRRGPLA